MAKLLSLLLLLGFYSARCAAIELVKHHGTDDSLDGQNKYFVNMLQLALDKSQARFGPAKRAVVDVPMGEQRQLLSLESNLLDVMWTMTSVEREKRAKPIRIPLLKGLLGYRALVIRKSEQAAFAQLTTIEQLKQHTAVQGFGWLDVKILQENGFKVETSSWHDSIYKSLHAGFYDYFPRSVIEVMPELAKYGYDNLTIDLKHILIYPTAIYFFVEKNNTELANRIEFGLLTAIADGSFDSLFYRYPQHSNTLKQLEANEPLVFHIDNPLLPETTPTDNKTLWYKLTTFKTNNAQALLEGR